MADILTAKLDAIYRTSSTAVPDWSTESWPSYVVAPTKGEINRFSVSLGPAFTYSLAHYSSIMLMAVWSLETLGALDVTYNDGPHNISQRVAGGGPLVVSAVNPAVPLSIVGVSGLTPFLLMIAGT